ncbi:MAG: peptidase domain-containing ABC transporter [Desulfovibrio aminophilus]|uniref:peptidase domain-containing ABC transporter n=1 Tax=Desulfovibrio aminophilus TaxID=81425 RepID=UPI0039EB5793
MDLELLPRLNLTPSQILWLLGSLCQLHRIPFDPSLALQQYPPPHTVATLVEAARALGFKAGDTPAVHVRWNKLPGPCIAFLVPEKQPPPQSSGGGACCGASTQPQPDPVFSIPALVIKSDGKQILFFRAGSDKPETVPAEAFAAAIQPVLIFVSREAEEGLSSEDAGLVAGLQAFGFRWFIPELLKHKKIWRDILVASLCLQVVGLLTPLFTQVIIDKVVVHQTQSTLIVVGVALVLFMIFSAIMTWLRQYLVLHTGNRIDAVLGSHVFRHLLRLPLPYFEHRPTGVLVARLHGVETIREFVSGAAFGLILDLPFLLIFLAVMFGYSWQLSLIAVFLLGLIAFMSALVTPVFRNKLNHQFMLGARNQAFLTEYVSGMETVKSLQMEPQLEQRYGDYLAGYLSAGFSTRQVGNTYNVAANSIEQIMSLSILVVGALLVMRNDGFTVGMLVAFQMFVSRMSQPMLRLVSLYQEFQQANIAVKRLGDIMDMPAEPHTLVPTRAGTGSGKVEFKDLSFRYSEQHPFLYRNLNLVMEPGKLTVVMGPSGCGKSTLLKLLQGFYPPTDGQILLDGKDLRYLAANELRRNFGVVPQETVIFSGTVYENLIMAHAHASFEQVVEACKLAEIHEVIEKLPQGYQTQLGEHGVGLSGGQKQRLAIARALLKRPKILIFDEATSNLDQKTAEQFALTVNKLKNKATMLFIAHQLPKALQVDGVVQIGLAENNDCVRLCTI